MSSTLLATALVVPFEQLRMTDVEAVGGKNASLGEMISQLTASGVRVPGGFATTAHAFRQFLRHGGLDQRIAARLSALNVDDVRALAEAGAQIRQWVIDTPFPRELEDAIRLQFGLLDRDADGASYAVRSSATAEDLPDASFAGQQDTYLNIHGNTSLLDSCRRCFASLFSLLSVAIASAAGIVANLAAISASSGAPPYWTEATSFHSSFFFEPGFTCSSRPE